MFSVNMKNDTMNVIFLTIYRLLLTTKYKQIKYMKYLRVNFIKIPQVNFLSFLILKLFYYPI